MSGLGLSLLLWFLAGCAAAAALYRVIAAARPSAALSTPEGTWPLLLRPFLGAARMIATVLDGKLHSGYCLWVRRRLEKADLYPGVDAAQWTALCFVFAVCSALLASVVAKLANMGILIPASTTLALSWIGCERWLRRRIAECERRIVRDLPPCLDLFTVCVEAGATLTGAARFIVEQAPEGPLRNYFDRVLREVRSGRPRAQAFISVANAYGVECLSMLASALAHAEAAGMSVGQVLRTQAEQRSTERFVRAERQAMQAPVKMLGPLIFCIFPCTFIVLAIPISHRLMEAFQS
jgi:tight adherence protein C